MKTHKLRVKDLNEKMMERYVRDYPDHFLGESLELLSQQEQIDQGRLDLLFKDADGFLLVVEIQQNALDRDHLYRALEYRDKIKTKHRIPDVRVLLLCNHLPTKYEQTLKIHDVEVLEIKRSTFVKKINQINLSEPPRVTVQDKPKTDSKIGLIKDLLQKSSKKQNSLDPNLVIYIFAYDVRKYLGNSNPEQIEQFRPTYCIVDKIKLPNYNRYDLIYFQGLAKRMGSENTLTMIDVDGLSRLLNSYFDKSDVTGRAYEVEIAFINSIHSHFLKGNQRFYEKIGDEYYLGKSDQQNALQKIQWQISKMEKATYSLLGSELAVRNSFDYQLSPNFMSTSFCRDYQAKLSVTDLKIFKKFLKLFEILNSCFSSFIFLPQTTSRYRELDILFDLQYHEKSCYNRWQNHCEHDIIGPIKLDRIPLDLLKEIGRQFEPKLR